MKKFITSTFAALLFLTATEISFANDGKMSLLDGCVDPVACNFDPLATEDDGSCCYDNCLALEVTAGGYPNEISFSIVDGENIVYYNHNAGDPLPLSVSLCMPNGCYNLVMQDVYGDGWNGATFSITDSDDNTIVNGEFPNEPAFESFSKTISFTLGGGIVGCTDSAACNFDPTASCDDASCDYGSCYGCTNPEACNYVLDALYDDGSCCLSNCLQLEMIDAFADGWDAGVYTLYTSLDEFVSSGTLAEGDYQVDNLCLEDGCYFIEISGSFFPDEIFWAIYGANGGDIYGDGLDNSIIYFSVGEGTCAGCNDPIACNFQPWASEDDGSCLYVPCVENDFRSAAIALAVNVMNTCATTTGDISLATISPEALSSALTGEDIWYSFVAATPGIRIETATTANNLVLELQDSDANMMDAEDIVDTNAGEILNYGNLTIGSTYYIAVRNYDSSQGEGVFSICLQSIAASRSNSNPSANYVMCSRIKARYVGAPQYTFNFTSVSTDVNYSRTTNGGVILIHMATGIMPEDDYEVNIEAVWQLTNGAGEMETVSVHTDLLSTLHLSPNVPVKMRSNENCTNAGAIPKYTVLRALPSVCGIIDYEWEFIDNDGISPVINALRGAPDKFISLNSIPSLQNGHSYQVRVRLIYPGNVPGTYGPAECVSIAATNSFMVDGSAPDMEELQLEELPVGIYPNPNNGSSLYLEILELESDVVNVSIIDSHGKQVFANRYVAEEELNTVIYFEQTLPAGLYMMNIRTGEHLVTKKFIVNK